MQCYYQRDLQLHVHSKGLQGAQEIRGCILQQGDRRLVYKDINETKFPRSTATHARRSSIFSTATTTTTPLSATIVACAIDECVAMDSRTPSMYPNYEYKDEFFYESSDNIPYLCIHKPKWNRPCTAIRGNVHTSCTLVATWSLAYSVTITTTKCSDVTNPCVSVIFPAAFLDVCGSCVKNYSDGPELNDLISATQCICEMKMLDFATATSSAAIIGVSSTPPRRTPTSTPMATCSTKVTVMRASTLPSLMVTKNKTKWVYLS